MSMRTLTPAGKFWLSYLATVVLVAAVSCTPAPALAAERCTSLEVEVLPLVVREDHSVPVRELSRMAHSDFTVGAVFAQRTWTIDGCRVTVGYTNVVLRVAAELTGNACTFAHVMTHEQEHLAIYRRHLATLAARVQARAAEADLDAVLDDETKSARADHAALDSPEEYHANVTACRGRILSLTNFR
jgi:hypothetical protein